MCPLLEMSDEKHKYIDKILYIYNAINTISDQATLSMSIMFSANFTRRQKQFKSLK